MDLWQIEGNKLRLKLHSGQAKAWKSQRRFVFIIAGKQGGKTSFLPWWLWREIQQRGAGDYIAATATQGLFEPKFLPEMRTVFEKLLGRGRYWAGSRIIELSDPSGNFLAKRSSDLMWGRIILRTAESKGGFTSATAKAAILDEVGLSSWTLEHWEEILARVSLHQGRICGATSIYHLGWLRFEVYDEWLNGNKRFDVSQFASVVNPSFPKDEFEWHKNRMQDWRFQMAYLGQFAKPASLIYKNFDENTMLCDPFFIPDDWPRVIGVDFGGANTATLHAALNPSDDRWYLYRETLEGGKSTQAHVNTQRSHLKDAEDYELVGGAKSEGQQRMDWADAGLYVEEPFVSDVEGGIDRVTELIIKDRLRVFRGLNGLRDELGSYSRKLDPMGNPTDDIKDKRMYHRLDALRYLSIQIVEGSGVVVGMGYA